MELRKHVSTIDKISLLVRQHYYAKISKVTICFKGSSHVSTKQKNKAQRVAPRPPSRAVILDHITWHLWSTGRSNKNTAIQIAKNETHRIHSCMYGIYANIGGILMGSMLPYIAAPWILWVSGLSMHLRKITSRLINVTHFKTLLYHLD